MYWQCVVPLALPAVFGSPLAVTRLVPVLPYFLELVHIDPERAAIIQKAPATLGLPMQHVELTGSVAHCQTEWSEECALLGSVFHVPSGMLWQLQV